MTIFQRFDEPHQSRQRRLGWDYRDSIPMDTPETETSRQVGMMFSAAISVILDPEAPPDCLAWKKLGPVVEAGVDLSDDGVQEDVLAYLQRFVWIARDDDNERPGRSEVGGD